MAGPLTVTVTPPGNPLLAVTVLALTGAAASQPGSVVRYGGISAPLTPTGTGSIVIGMMYEVSGIGFAGEWYSPLPSTSFLNDAWSSTTTHGEAVSFISASPTTAGVPVTLGAAPQSGTEYEPGVILAEILSAAGALAVDPSSPPPLPGPSPQNDNLVHVTGLTTDAFSPPDGALLAVMAVMQGSGSLSVSDSSGLGLSWVQQEFFAGSPDIPTNGGIWTAQLPAPPPAVALPDAAGATEQVTIAASTGLLGDMAAAFDSLLVSMGQQVLAPPTVRVVASDVIVSWDGGNPLLVKRGTLVAIPAGSAMETAYGGPANTPAASQVQIEAANGGIDPGIWTSN